MRVGITRGNIALIVQHSRSCESTCIQNPNEDGQNPGVNEKIGKNATANCDTMLGKKQKERNMNSCSSRETSPTPDSNWQPLD